MNRVKFEVERCRESHNIKSCVDCCQLDCCVVWIFPSLVADSIGDLQG